MPDDWTPNDFFELARREMERANELHSPRFASLHEGYAVLLEEVDELWEAVKARSEKRDVHHLLAECLQIAAMAGKIAYSAGLMSALEVPSAGGSGDLVHELANGDGGGS